MMVTNSVFQPRMAAPAKAQGSTPQTESTEEVYTPTPDGTISPDVKSEPTPLINKLACGAVLGSAAWLATNVALQVAGAGSVAGAVALGAGALASAAAGYVAADLTSGVFHHWIDNYPTYQTPVIGDTAYAFQVHHHKVHDLETESIWTNMAAAGRFMWIPMAAVAATGPNLAVQAATLGFTLGGFLAQGSHRWTHEKNPPKIASLLQKMHLMQSREQHALHHKMPWADNYCIVNGMWNPLLSRTHFFRKWEKAIYQVTGKEPHCWKDPGVKAFALGQISENEFLANQGLNRKIFRNIVKGEFDAEFERRAQLRMEREKATHS